MEALFGAIGFIVGFAIMMIFAVRGNSDRDNTINLLTDSVTMKDTAIKEANTSLEKWKGYHLSNEKVLDELRQAYNKLLIIQQKLFRFHRVMFKPHFSKAKMHLIK